MSTSLTKELLKELLDSNKREKYIKEICQYLDNRIKSWLLNKKFDYLYVETMTYSNETRSSYKNEFYKLWEMEDLSKESRKAVRNKIVEIYSEFFDVKDTTVDIGMHQVCDAIKFQLNPDKLS